MTAGHNFVNGSQQLDKAGVGVVADKEDAFKMRCHSFGNGAIAVALVMGG